jgi:DNA-binding LacI/PurR family transcriptional regulator
LIKSPSYDKKIINPYHTEQAYQTLTVYLSKRAPTFDAIFTGDDDAAIGALNALQYAGIRVPEDVSVTGFDDSRISRYIHPLLT